MRKNSNYLELIDYMGSDKLHGLAAWASTFAEFDMDYPEDIEDRVDVIVDHILNNGKRKRSLEELIDFLASEGHSSPFRFSTFVFAGAQDVATHIQKLKHRVLLEAENASSARYKELKDEFYVPSDWPKHLQQKLVDSTNAQNKLYHEVLEELIPIVGRNRAKESARYFKTYNTQISSMNKFSFDGVIQFYYKRIDAQKEIAEMSADMVNLIANIPNNPFQYSLKAFGLGEVF